VRQIQTLKKSVRSESAGVKNNKKELNMISTSYLFENPALILGAAARGIGSLGRGTGTMGRLFGRDRQTQSAMSAAQTGANYEMKPGQASVADQNYSGAALLQASKAAFPTDPSKWVHGTF